jgi:hypothetical protein
MKLSKEQKDQAIQKLSNPWGSINLICDGYCVALQVQRTSALSFRVMTFVNGEFKGSWCNAENECPESKFLRKTVRSLTSPSRKRELEKILGKRHVAKDPFYSKTHTYYLPDFASGKAAINHMCKVSESIQIVEES